MGEKSPVAKSKPAPSNMARRLSTRDWVVQEQAMSPRNSLFWVHGTGLGMSKSPCEQEGRFHWSGLKIQFSFLKLPSSHRIILRTRMLMYAHFITLGLGYLRHILVAPLQYLETGWSLSMPL
jgi:hypothetical protein